MILDAVLDFLSNGLTRFSGWEVFFFTLIVTHITICGVTIYLHRSATHRGLDLHPIASHFFRFWLWMTTGMVTKQWVAIHRKHHAKCETEDDPHSPVVKGIKKVFFEGAELYRSEAKNQETLQKYGYGTPDDWIERNLYTKHSALGVSLMLILNVLLFGVVGLAVWAVQMAWIPFWAAGVVNGIGHYWGYRNYECNDAATNVFPIGIIIGGEELHNNHHTYGTSAKFSTKWYEIDIGWMYICMMSAVGLAKVKKVAPEPKFDHNKLHLDFDTLQSVISNRYDVTATYAKSVRRIWSEELQHLKDKAKLESRFLRSTRKLLHREPSQLEAPHKEQLTTLFQHSAQLKTMHEMRVELGGLWERSHASRDQLLQQLQDWCARAESSGIAALRDFSLRLRSYA